MAAVESDTVAVAETPETSIPKEEAPIDPATLDIPALVEEAEIKSEESTKVDEAETAGEQSVGQPAASEAEQKRKRASLLSLPFKKSSKKSEVPAEEVKPVEPIQESGALKKELAVEAQGTSAQKRKSLLNALRRVGSPKRDQFASPTETSASGKEDKVEEVTPDTETTPEAAVEVAKPAETPAAETGAHASKEGFLAQLLKKPTEKKEAPKKEKEVKTEGESTEAEASTVPAIEEVAKKAFAPFSKLFSSKTHEKAKPESSTEQVDASSEPKPEVTIPEAGTEVPQTEVEAPQVDAVVEATQSSPTVKARTFSIFGQKSKSPAPEQQKDAAEAQLASDHTGHNPTAADTRSAFRRMSSIFRSKSKSRENKEEPKPEIAQISEEGLADQAAPTNTEEAVQAGDSNPEEAKEIQGIIGDVPVEAITVAPETESLAKELEA